MSIKTYFEERKQRKERIAELCELSGWDAKKAKEELQKIEAIGMPFSRYKKNKCWELPFERVKDFNQRIEEKLAKGEPSTKKEPQNNLYVKIVCERTNWSYEKAKEHMDQLKERGIDYNTYVSKAFYEASPKSIENKIAYHLEKQEEYVARVCEATGWSREEAIKEMDRVKEEMKVSYFKYCSYRFYTLNDDEIRERLARWNATAKKQIEYVMQESGWDRKKVRLHMNKVRTVYDIPPDYYVLYRLWEATDEEIDTYARRKDSNRLFSKYNNKAETMILQNKEQFDRAYKDYIKRKFWVNKETNFEEFLEFIDGLEYIFCKPIDSGGGQGTEKIKIADYEPKELYDYLIKKERLLVEECVVQHPEIDKFVPGCVNTIRVITLLKDDVCHLICAGIRMGNSGIVDNFHVDGMVCDVDLETGKIVTPAIDRMGNTYERHPKSGYEFVGFQIPNWDMVLKLAQDAIRVQPGVNYVGWDIAVCPDKAVIIEGNSAPDLVLIQAPYARKKIGKKYLFEPFL